MNLIEQGNESLESEKRLIVVAIGASAGGLRPLQEFFNHMPSDTNMCFVVVQHLSPDFVSVMGELLAKHTSMPIKTIEEGMSLKPNTVFLNPPRFNVRINENTFLLSEFDADELRFPINSMFHSLASNSGPDSVAVVLSGTGSDGASGIQSVSQMAGLTIVQSLESAQFDGMPVSAIATDVVDFVLSPVAISQLLIEHAVEPVLRSENRDSTGVENLTGVQLIFSKLASCYGINFAHYKPTTVARRIDRRLKLSRYGSLREYAEVLRNDAEELDLLYHDLLIGVTKFFRDGEAFELLRQEMASVIHDLPGNEQLRIWSVGCASGEESYSLAMMLYRLFEQEGRTPNFKVFATDVHDRMLEFASRGIYDSEALSTLPSELKSEFFTPCGKEKFKVIPRLRHHLVFAKQNVVNDPPFTKMDLVTCRNLLIYLQDDAQASAISGFRFALREEGLMLLGPSETVGKLSQGFDVIDKGWRLFRKNKNSVASVHRSSKLTPSAARQDASTLRLVEAESRTVRLSPIALLLLSRHLGSAVLMDSKRNILHLFGNADRLLQCEDGLAKGNLLNFFAEDARSAVATILIQANNDIGSTYETHNVRLEIRDKVQIVDMKAASFAVEAGDPPVLLLEILPSDTESDSDDTKESPKHSLSVELENTRDSLVSTIKEFEESNQELQAANEEMIASNEELQATNEELQSVNEELHTVNIEHQKKVQELEEVTDDFNNLFNSTGVGSILLDDDLCIRKFTVAAKQYFNLMDHDVGRPLSNFASQIMIEEFSMHVRTVKETGSEFFSYAKDRNDQWLSVEILPYNTNNQISGVIINLLDLTTIIHSIAELKEEFVIEPDAAIWQWDERREQMWWSPQLYNLFDPKDKPAQPGWTAFQSIAHEDDASRITLQELKETSQRRVQQVRLRVGEDEYQEFDLRWCVSVDRVGNVETITGSFAPATSRVPAPKLAKRYGSSTIREPANRK